MKVRIYSDLHLEFLKEAPPLDLPPVDLVVLAGDIGVGTQGIQWAKSAFKNQPVVYVMGNHEYYGGEMNRILDMAKAEAAGSNVHLLERSTLELPNVTVLGCTLWTDFKLLRAAHQNVCKARARQFMMDYSSIQFGRRIVHPDDTQRISEASYLWMYQTIRNSTKPIIAVTHHAPSMKMGNPNYDLDEMSACFASHYDALLQRPVKLWVWGHMHHCFDYEEDGIRRISHQKGYPRENIEGFDWGKVFDVEI